MEPTEENQNIQKVLGKIQDVSFGHISDYEVGLCITFKTSAGNVQFSQTFFNVSVSSEGKEWEEEDRTEKYAEIVKTISVLLSTAKVSDIKDLVGIPVEVSFNGSLMESWRILVEVL